MPSLLAKPAAPPKLSFFGNPKFFARIFFVLFILAALAFILLPLPGTIPVLMYHEIGASPDTPDKNNFIPRDSLKKQLTFLHFFKYRVLSMDEYSQIKNGKRKPLGREVLITFDDGKQSFADSGFDLFKEYAFPVTLFVISEHVKNGTDGSMDAGTLKRLLPSGLVTIGSHSKTHPHLPEITEAQIQDEVANSKKDLESLLGAEIRFFAYPCGGINASALNAVKNAGYDMAFATNQKSLKDLPEGIFSMTRIKIFGESDNPVVFWYYLSGIHQTIKAAGARLKTLF